MKMKMKMNFAVTFWCVCTFILFLFLLHFYSTSLPSYLHSDAVLLPAQQRSPGTKCSPAYQTRSLHSGDNQSEFIAPWNLTHYPTGWLIFMSFGCFSRSQPITLQINQWLSLPPSSILCGSLLSRPAVQLQMLWGSGHRSVVVGSLQ